MKAKLCKTVFSGTLLALMVLAVSCGGAASPTDAPQPTDTAAPTTAPSTDSTAPSPSATPLPTVAPTVTPPATQLESARDSITLVMPEEPAQLNPLQSIGASTNAYVTRDNVAEPLTWQSGDDQRIVPTSATESWTQTAPDRWQFKLRQGVTFSNGEAYNAQATVPSLEFLGDGTNNNSSFPYTGGFKPEAVDEFTLDIVCDDPCPIFPNTAFFTGIQAPGYLAANPTVESRARSVIGFGPYVLKEWNPGVSITQEAYEGYTPVGDHYEFQKPRIKDVTWVWRGETTVMVAMVKTQEADLAWDVSVDAAEELPEDMIALGSSAEVYAFSADTLWHPELKKTEVRQAINHAINCQEIVDTLYHGLTECVGNIIWNGVIGATEENTAPYEYNPEKARQLLQQAGYDPANEIDIFTRATRIPKQIEVAEAYQAYMSQVGITAEINVVESALRQERTACGVGNTLNQVMADSGRDPSEDTPTREDFQQAIQRGELCPRGDLMENEPSNETLDFGRQANWYMNCTFVRSMVCDPSPGGIQEMLPLAVSAGGEERQMRMQQLADIMHNDSLFIFAFKLPLVYAKDAKLEFHPRFDGRIRVNHLWFQP
jgi:peptide/nickel transport system substrate-binding protein